MPLKAARLLAQRVHCDPSGVSQFVVSEDSLAPHLPRPAPGRYLAVKLVAGSAEPSVDLKVWRLPWHAPGLCLWWEMPSIFSALWQPGPVKTSIGDSISNSWASWEKWCSAIAPPVLCLRKAICRRGLDLSWGRCLPEPTWSTLGLLSTLIAAANLARGTPRAYFVEALDGLFRHFLEDVECKLFFIFDAELADAYMVPGVAPPRHLRQACELHGPCIDPDLLAPLASPPLSSQIAHFARKLRQKHSPIGPVPLGVFLVELHNTPTLSWLLRGVLFQVAIMLEKIFPSLESTSNPIGFETGVAGRQDADLAEHLTEGLGGGAEEGRATFPEQHTRSYLLLRQPRKLKPGVVRRGVGVADSRAKILLRYLDVSKDWLKGCRHLVVLTDASRLGGKEVQLFAVGGADSLGEFRMVWAPPQVWPLL